MCIIENMNTTTGTPSVKFVKRQPGLYGTGIWHDSSTTCEWHHCNVEGCVMVETCIDRYTCSYGWNVRYVCEHDCFTDSLGEWFTTLTAGKEYFAREEVK